MEDRQLLIEHCSSHRSIARYSSRIEIFAYPICIRRPHWGSPSQYCRDVWYGKTRMVCYPICE